MERKMAEVKGNKKRLTINLSFFTPSTTTDSSNTNYSCNPSTKSTSSTRSLKNKFEEPNGVVGLGIVVAHDHPNLSSSSRNAIFAVSPRSNPIPIFSKGRGGGCVSSCQEMMELSEEYTCVISHVGKNVIKKREYFDDGELGMGSTKRSTGYWASSSANGGGGGVFCAASPVDVGMGQVFQSEDFLSYCFLCKKKLLGLDIFMYRGEKAFCSADCRYKQMSVDEHKEKCGSGVKKPLEYSVSPCSGSMQFHTGVAAA